MVIKKDKKQREKLVCMSVQEYKPEQAYATLRVQQPQFTIIEERVQHEENGSSLLVYKCFEYIIFVFGISF